MLLANEEAAVGVVWSGDASEIISENDKLDYVIPREALTFGSTTLSYRERQRT